MTALELGGMILAAEFALIAWTILFLLLKREKRAAAQDEAHVSAVIEKVEDSEDSRREALAGIFASTYQLEGAELQATVDEYLEREKAFYHAMLNIYLERKGEKLNEMPKELTKVLAPMVHMTPANMIDPGQIEHLENANAQLAAELDDTQNTLTQLMDEYNAAFNRANASDAASAPDAKPEPEPAPASESIEAPLAESIDDLLDDLGIPQETVEDAPAPTPESETLDAEAIDDLLDDLGIPQETVEDAPAPKPEPETLDAEAIDDLLDGLGIPQETVEDDFPEFPKTPPEDSGQKQNAAQQQDAAPDPRETVRSFELSEEIDDEFPASSATDQAESEPDDDIWQEQLDELSDLFEEPGGKKS